MNKDTKLNIAAIKSLKNKAKTWIYEWLIAYVFLTSLLFLLLLYIEPYYFLSIGAMFFVITVLTMNLISIERKRINDCDDILIDLKNEIKHSYNIQEELEIILIKLKLIQNHFSHPKDKEYNNKEILYLYRQLHDKLKTILNDNFND